MRRNENVIIVETEWSGGTDMILFRRVGEAFRRIEDREWLLLTLETMGVLAGILIAFELQQWGAQRDQAAKHHELMERLFEESASDVSAIRDWRDTLQPMIEREQVFAVRLSGKQCPTDADFQAITDLGMMPALSPPVSVYQELMGAGGLSSIERRDIREHLAQFHADIEWAQGQIDYFRAVKIEPVSVSDPRVSIRFDPAKDEPQVSAYNGRALCSDPGFKNRVAVATREHKVFLSYFQATLDDAIDACVRLGHSLGHRCTPPYGGPLTADDAKYAGKVVAKMREDLAHPS